MTWAEFRQSGLLGCAHDYTLFEKDLTPLLQRAHEGATHHVGKVPARRGGTGVPMKRQVDVTKLRQELRTRRRGRRLRAGGQAPRPDQAGGRVSGWSVVGCPLSVVNGSARQSATDN